MDERERVAKRLWEVECPQPHTWDEANELQRGDYYRLADAAIAEITTPSPFIVVRVIDWFTLQLIKINERLQA